MGKNSGSSQINQADQYYQQEAQNSDALMKQFNDMYLPILKQFLPELQGTLSGDYTPLSEAAQAPVKANTAQMLRTLQNNAGSATNPDALYSDLMMGGNTSAALSSDQMLSQALAALQGLTGQGYGSVNTAMTGANNAAGGEGQIGTNLNNSNNAMWGSIFQGLGTAAGAMGSSRAPLASSSSAVPGSVAQPAVQTLSGQPSVGLSGSTMPWLYSLPSVPISAQRPPTG